MSERSGSLKRFLRSAPAVVVFASVVTVGVTVAPASAATLTGVTVRANLADHLPASSGNCIRYSPTSNPSTSPSDWVTSSGEARTAHGSSDGTCPTNLDVGTQSAVGFVPTAATSFNTGTTFLIGRMSHYNNPIQASDSRFTGNLDVDFGGTALQFPWALWETPNNATGANCPTGTTADGCNDEVVFSSQIAPVTISNGGMTYKMVLLGFVQNPNTTCPASAAVGATINNQFITAERTTTHGCLYAQITQVRPLVIKKAVASAQTAPTTVPAFGFTPTSSLAGSPWTGSFNLTPTVSTPASSTTRDFLPSSEDLSIVEGAPPANWALTGIVCVDGAGVALAGATYDVATRTLALNNVPDATTAAAAPITCTFTNTYTARATLTLVKTVDNGGVGTAVPGAWTLAAAGTTNISGTSGNAAVTNQSVIVGTYTLSESGSPVGYVQNGAWTCATAAGASVTVTNSKVAVTDGQNVTCTVNNRFSRGQFSIAKIITDASDGFTGSNATNFTFKYKCGTAAEVTGMTVSISAPFTSPLFPVGTSCVITETQPSGNLKDTSFIWNGPTYSPGNATVTIVDNTTVPLTITNSISRQLGTLTLTKVVTPRDAASAGGYTGGTTRVFPIAYECKIGAAVVASGTRNVTTAAGVQITGIPATSICTASEAVVTTTAGDFVNASFAWDGYTASTMTPATVPVGGNASITVTNFYIRKFANLTLVKVVQGPGYIGSGMPFTLNYNCGTGYTGSVDLAPAGSQTVVVPANTPCTVSETLPLSETLLLPAYDWGTPTYAGLTNGTVTVAPSGTATVTVTNPTVAVFGKVRINKVVTGDQAGLAGGTTFKMRLLCSNGLDTTQQVAAGTPYTSVDLPVGTSCTVTELVDNAGTPLPGATGTSVGLTGESYGWGTVPAPASVTVASSGSIADATLTNNIVRRYGSLTIDKLLDVPGGMPGNATGGITYSGTWSCTLAATTVNGTWARSGAGAATLTGPATSILLGSSCTVLETAVATNPSSTDPSYHWGSTVITGPVTVSAAAPVANVEVTNKVVRYSGSLAITKTVVGPAAGYDNAGLFTFSVVCTTGAATTINTSVSILNGATQAVPDVPAGSSCVVTETAMPPANSSYEWDSVGFAVTGATGTTTPNSVSFTMPADANASVAVLATNTISLHTANVVINKVITGATTGYTGGGNAVFQVTLTCNGVSVDSKPVANAAGVTFLAVPVGQTCTVSEANVSGNLRDGSFAWGSPTYSAAITVTEGAANSLTVTNPITRVYTNVALTKAVKLNGITGVVTVGTAAFSGSWSCTYAPDNVVVNGTWTVTGAGVATLTGPSTSILVGSTCTATENALAPPSADPSYQWLTPVITFDTSTRTFTVTNELVRRTATITIAKTVSGQVDGLPAGSTFDFTAVCKLTGFADIIRTANGVVAGSAAVVIVPDAPVGWSCSITESVPTLKDASYTWGTPVWSPSPTVAVTTAGASYARVVDNPINRVAGTLEITKALANTPSAAVKANAIFTGTYSCSYGATLYTGTWSAKIGEVATLTATTNGSFIPVTASCSVTEDAPSDSLLADASWSWNAAVIAPATDTVDGVQAPATFTVTNSARRVYGSLSVTKEFSGVGGLKLDATVQGSWSCTWDAAGSAGGRWMLPAAGGTQLLFAASDALVPLTAKCTVTEDTLLQSDLFDTSFAWNAPQYAPLGGNVTLDAGTNLVTITNSTQRVYGGFRIEKTVIGKADAGITFSGSYTCTHPGDADVTANWSGLTVAAPVDINGILLESSCSVVETWPPAAQPVAGDGSWVWVNNNNGTPIPSITVTRKSITVTNTSQQVLGSFVIAKAPVAGASDGVLANSTYGFDWKCDALDGTLYSGTVTGRTAGGAAGEIGTNVPAFSTCTVTEQTLPGSQPSFHWGTPTFTVTGVGENGSISAPGSIKFVLPFSGAVVVTATNSLAVSAEVAKTFVGSAQHLVAGAWDGTWDLTYHVLVTNPSAVAPLSYSLTDSPQTIAGVTYNNGIVTSTQLTSPITWDGTTLPLVIVAEATPVVLPASGSHQYTVVLNLSAPHAGVAEPSKCQIGVDGVQQLGNSATVSTDGRTDTASDCGEVPPTPSLAIVKDVTVAPSQDGAGVWTVGYRVTVTNTSAVLATKATVEDTLEPGAGVTVTSAAISGPGASATWNGVSDTRVVTDRVLPAAGTLVYDVVLKATSLTTITTEARNCALVGQETGTGFLNVALATNGSTTVTDDACAEIPVHLWTLVKTSDPVEGTTVKPGQVVTYTLTVTNTSKALVTGAKVADNLADVLDDAVLSPLVASLSVSGNNLTWTVPDVAPGASASVSYSVTLLPTAWGHTLRNVAAPLTTGGSCPGDLPIGVAAALAADCTTSHPVPAWSLSKVSNPPDGSTVQPGSNVTYTLTVINTSSAVVTGAVVVDDMSKVLANATIAGGLPADTVLAVTNFTWFVPTLQPGGSASISYTVRINDNAFNATLTNVATPEANSGGECVNACSTTTRTKGPAVEPPTVLPVTGAQLVLMLQWGAMLLAAGLVLVAWRRRATR